MSHPDARTPETTREHDLKTWAEFFPAILDGSKLFEIRRDDRAFKVGDVLRLREFDPFSGDYTGRETRRTVSYITNFAQQDGYVVLGLAALSGGAGEGDVWQPMETATKDGTYILLTFRGEVSQGWWDFDRWIGFGLKLGTNEPDGWKPLPAPPAATPREEDR